MEIINSIPERMMLVRTHKNVIIHRGSLFNAARKWWWWYSGNNKPADADYVMVDVDGIVQEIYKPTSWHKETDPKTDILSFSGERWVFGEIDDSDDGMFCKRELASDDIRYKYKGKELSGFYRFGNNRQNPVRFSF